MRHMTGAPDDTSGDITAGVYDTAWAARMTVDADTADAYFGVGDSFDPHNGTTTDLNQFGPDLLAEPDADADPTR